MTQKNLLQPGIKYDIQFKAENVGKLWEMAGDIHYQLRGNRDYIENRIVLQVREDVIHLIVKEGVEEIPALFIFGGRENGNKNGW